MDQEIDRRVFDPKHGVGFVRDPLYSYIALTTPLGEHDVCEQTILDSPWMQRLRRIRANQWAYMVYPGLQHTRFEHSLGVMHLAGDFARTWYRQYRNAFHPGAPSKRFPTVEFVEELARLAGLLHDVGHGPFGHTFEKAALRIFGRDFPNHEKVGVEVIRKKFAALIAGVQRSPSGPFAEGETLKWEQVAYLANPDYKPRSLASDEKPIVELLHPLISGLFGVDRLDYLTRDAHHGGTREYGTMDIYRLRTTVYLTREGEIAIPENSMPALRNMLLARLQMYETCYFHPRVRAFEIAAELNMANMLKSLEFPRKATDPTFLQRYQELDDHWVYVKGGEWAKDRRPDRRRIGQVWQDLFTRKKTWRCAHEIPRQLSLRFLNLVKEKDQEIERRLVALLEQWRKEGTSPNGILWPPMISKRADLGSLIALDAPVYVAGITSLVEGAGPYTIVGKDASPIREGTAKRVLATVAGVNLIFFRFFAVECLSQLVAEAAKSLEQSLEYLKPDPPSS
jgi:HD superfamily phosphohydrolase